MKSSILVSLVATLVSVPGTTLSALELTAEERAFIDQHTSNLVRFEAERLDDLALDAVFATPFYAVKVINAWDGGYSTLVATRLGDELVSVVRPGEDGDQPQLLEAINPAFKLRTITDGKMMQQAFNVLYPPFMESEKKLLSFRQDGTTWVFVRGEFFESKSGYVIETAADGAITSIKYLLRLP